MVTVPEREMLAYEPRLARCVKHFLLPESSIEKEGGRKVHNFAVRVQVEDDVAKKVGEEECKFISAANLV